MKKVILLTLLAVTLFSAPTYLISAPIHEPQKIEVVIPVWVFPFVEKMNVEIEAKCKELGIPFPKLKLEFNPSPIVVSTITGEIQGWILGYYTYENKTINVFLFGGYYGAYFDEISLRHTILHEVLHYWDDLAGKPQAPMDHNDIFEKRLKDLGWW